MKLCGNKKEKNIGSKSILENSSGLKKKNPFLELLWVIQAIILPGVVNLVELTSGRIE